MPKDRAYDLVILFTDKHNNVRKDLAKKFALIAVDSILDTLNFDIRDLDVRGSVLLDLIQYWRDVKQEIEKL
jgi:hypothetical protein